MRPCRLLAACAALVLWPVPADAQPLFRRERAWTVEVGGRAYGWCDVAQAPGDWWWTVVWVAGRPLAPAHRAEDRWVLAVPPVAAFLAVRYLTRPFARGGK